jgi:hypothetical protein
MALIGISGKSKSGKDTVGKIIQRLIHTKSSELWEIKRFSDKLKIISAVLTGFPVHYFEDQEFKDSEMEVEWDYIQDGFLRKRAEDDDRKKYTYREFLQRLGTDAIRNNLHDDTWINALFVNYHAGSNWIITDLRFPNEADAIKSLGGIIIRVDRPLEDRYPELTKSILDNFNHESETALDNYEFDAVIDNNGPTGHLEISLNEYLKSRELI